MSRLPAGLVAAGVVAGIWAAERLGRAPAGAVGTAMGAAALAGRRRLPAGTTLGLLAFVVGVARAPAPVPADPPPPGSWVVEGTALDHARAVGGGWRFPLRVDAARGPAGEVPPGVRLLVTVPGGAPPGWGARVRLHGRLRHLPGYENPGTFSYPAYLRRQGVRWAFAASGPAEARGGALGWWLGGVRARMAAALAAGAGPRAPWLQALALGDADALSSEQRRHLGAAGLAHAVAASGLHVAAVAWLAERPAARLPPGWRLVAAWAAAVAYAALVGPAPSLLRATLVVGLVRALRLGGRPADPLAVTALTAAALLLAEPRVLHDLGFQLSFAAVAGMVLLVPDAAGSPRPGPPAGSVHGPRGGRAWAAWVVAAGRRTAWAGARLVVASAAAQLAVLPLLAAHWGEVAQLAPLANAVALPLLLGLLPAAVLAALVAAAWPAAGAAWSWVLAWPAGACDALVAWLGSLPGTSRALPPGGGWAGVLFWALLAGVAGDGRHALVRLRQPRLGRWAPWAAALALAAALWGWRPQAPPRALEVTFLDGGQGDAVVVRAPPGVVMVVDGGEAPGGTPRAAERAVLPYLRRAGVDRIHLLVASHYDADHAAGLPAVARALPVGALLLPPPAAAADSADATYAAALTEAPAGTRAVAVREGVLPLGAARLEVLPPPPPGLGGNEASLALRLCYAGRAVLLTGDAGLARERAWLADGVDLRAEVLKVGHHGSATGTGSAFLQRVRPRMAVIPVGRENRYGLPNAGVVQRLREHGVRVYRTDLDGAVQVRVDVAGTVAVRTARGGWRQEVARGPWPSSTPTRRCGASPKAGWTPSTW